MAFKFNQKNLGIEIGTDTIKLALCSPEGIKTVAVRRLPDNLVHEGLITAPNVMSDFIRQMMKDYGLKCTSCSVVLPSEILMAHRATLPLMNEAELKLNLPFEFRDFVGKEGASYDYDYTVISTDERAKTMELYTAACRKAEVNSFSEIMKKAGLAMKVAIPAEMAWLNLINSAENAPKKLCIVDCGCTRTRVSIFADGHFEMGRAIDLAGLSLDNAISEREKLDPFAARTRKEADMENINSCEECTDIYSTIAVEVMRVVNFFRSSDVNGDPLQDIYYCGGTAMIESLRTAILKRTNLTMHHIGKLVKGENLDEDLTLRAALACGAGIQTI